MSFTTNIYEIPLKPENQTFRINLNGTDYTFTLRWNHRSAHWILNIGDTFDNPLINGIPLVIGVNLLAGYKSFAIGGVGTNLFIRSIAENFTTNFLPRDPEFADLGTNTRLYFGVNVPDNQIFIPGENDFRPIPLPTDVVPPSPRFILFDDCCHLYISEDYGAHWKEYNSPVTDEYNTMSNSWSYLTMAINDGDYVTASKLDPGFRSYNPLIGNIYGGMTINTVERFTTTPMIPVNFSYRSAIAISRNAEIVFVSNYNGPCHISYDRASTWIEVYPDGVPSNPSIYRSIWNGVAFSENVAHIYVAKLDGHIWKSVDQGVTWIELLNSFQYFSLGGSYYNAANKIVSSKNGLIVVVVSQLRYIDISLDGGNTWSRTDFEPYQISTGAGFDNFDFSMTPDGSIILVCGADQSTNPRTAVAWISTDHGITWRATGKLPDSDDDNEPFVCAVSPGGRFMMVAYGVGTGFTDGYTGARAAISTDSGKTWVNQIIQFTAPDQNDSGFWLPSAFIVLDDPKDAVGTALGDGAAIGATKFDQSGAGTAAGHSFVTGTPIPPTGLITLLCHFDGTSGSTTFIDSLGGHTLAPASTTVTSTAKIGTGAGNFTSNTASRIVVSQPSDFNILNFQFTIDAWVYFTTNPGTGNVQGILTQWGGNINYGWFFGYVNGLLSFYWSTNGGDNPSIGINFTPVLNTWYHVAVDRDATNTLRLYLNGQVIASDTVPSIFPSTQAAVIGNDNNNSRAFPGYIDELRMIFGYADYKGVPFRPPVYPYGIPLASGYGTAIGIGPPVPIPALDNFSTGTTNNATSLSATITTSSANDVICALVYAQRAGTIWVTGVSGGGLTWNKRTQSTAGTVSLELWWAIAPSPLSGVTITATTSSTVVAAAMIVFGVSGCSIPNPWDSNASLAAKLYNILSGNVPTFNSISTDQGGNFLIFATGVNTAQNAVPPAGFTSIGSAIGFQGNASVGAAYMGVQSPITNQTFAWGTYFGSSFNAAIFDALTYRNGITTQPLPNLEILTTVMATSVNTVSLSTAGISANNVLVVISYCELSSGPPAITGIVGGGLTWTPRSRSHSSSTGSLEVWYAPITGTLVQSTITITYAANFDNADVELLSVVGCGPLIWDVYLPSMVSNPPSALGGVTPWTPSVTVSTNAAQSLMLAMTGTAYFSSGVGVPPLGYNLISVIQNGGGSRYAYMGTGVQSRNSIQTLVPVTWGAAITDAYFGGEYIVDALTTATYAEIYSVGTASGHSPTRGFSVDPITATWDPAHKGTLLTLSGGNLVATSSAGSGTVNSAVYATWPIISTSKVYFEVTITGTVGQYLSIGVMNGNASLSANLGATNGVALVNNLSSGTRIYLNGSTISISTYPNFSSGQVIRVAIDRANNKIWWAVNNNPWTAGATPWIGSSGTFDDPGTGAGGFSLATVTGPIYPAISSSYTGDVCTLNGGGSTPFAYPVPSGFIGINVTTSTFLVGNAAGNSTVSGIVTSARVTQVATEEWAQGTSDARVTQVATEEWYKSNPDARVTQVAVEEWTSVT